MNIIRVRLLLTISRKSESIPWRPQTIFSRSYERLRLWCNVTSVWRQSVVCSSVICKLCIVAKRYGAS